MGVDWMGLLDVNWQFLKNETSIGGSMMQIQRLRWDDWHNPNPNTLSLIEDPCGRQLPRQAMQRGRQ